MQAAGDGALALPEGRVGAEGLWWWRLPGGGMVALAKEGRWEEGESRPHRSRRSLAAELPHPVSCALAVTGPTLVQPSSGRPFLAVGLVLSPDEWLVNYTRLNDHSGHLFHKLWESL